MIQRIQSVYLILTFLLSVLFLNGEFFSFSNPGGTRIMMNFNGLWRTGDAAELVRVGNHYFLTILFVIIALISVFDIFMYKNRKLQLLLAKILVLFTSVSSGLIIFYIIYIPGRYEVTFSPGIRMFIPLVIFVLCLLAHRGIRKDEDLIRSYDTLR